MEINDQTRLIDLTVGELRSILSGTHIDKMALPERRMVYGIAGIASLFHCSMTTANRIKASGKIDSAISQSGRTIAIDADLALSILRR